MGFLNFHQSRLRSFLCEIHYLVFDFFLGVLFLLYDSFMCDCFYLLPVLVTLYDYVPCIYLQTLMNVPLPAATSVTGNMACVLTSSQVQVHLGTCVLVRTGTLGMDLSAQVLD